MRWRCDRIRMSDIDHAAARGMSRQGQVTGPALPVITPLLSQAMVARGSVENPAVYTALTVLIAQSTMVVSAQLAGRLALRRGYGTCRFVALPLRGLTLGLIESPWAAVPGQILDGVGGGMVAVAALGLAARLMSGTGHATARLGFVLTMHGFGSTMSVSIGGVIGQTMG